MRRFALCLVPIAILAVARPAGVSAQTWVSIAPPNKVVVGTTQLPVTVLWCDYSGQIDVETRTIKLNGVDITSQFDLQWNPTACGFKGRLSDQEFYSSTGVVTLTGGSSFDLRADIADDYNDHWTADNTYKLPDSRRRVVVVADAQFVTVPPGSAQAPRFTLYNSGNAVDTFSISATCTGTAVQPGCNPSTGYAVVGAGQSAAVTVSYTASGTTGTAGQVLLRGRRYSDASFADSSWTSVTVAANASPGVVVVGYAPGVDSVLERDLCVTAAAGSGAAAECGDLRLAHALPSVRTLGSQRVPTLLYNSQHARPKPLVLANVTLPATGQGGAQYPTTVQGCITIGGVPRGCASWQGSQWGALGITRRVVIPGDDNAWPTAINSIRVVVTYTWPGNTVTADTSAITPLLVVNRSASPFGAGWWLAGLEQLVVQSGSQVLWIGGDGSARIYTNNGSGVYRARSLDRPDSITCNVTCNGGGYIRWAPGRTQVFFNSAGRHDSTVNRLQYVTRFGYDGNGRLTSIQVPTTGSSLWYTFGYGGNGVLSTVSAPGNRQATAYTTGARVDAIQDPDGNRVSFGGYGTGLNQYRVGSRTDRNGHVTTFSWNDALQRLTQVTRPLSIATTFVFAETQGYSTALPLDSAYTSISGPRTDVSQVTKLWINGYGAPTRVRNAIGRETQIGYDATWPGLASIVIGPSGLRTRRVYGGTGLPQADTVFSPLGNSQNAVTQYQWDPKWREVTQITSATGVVTSFSYDGTYGFRLWEQLGSDQSHRVNYAYNSSRLLASVTAPLVPAETFVYDGLGNLRTITTPGGNVTSSYGDALGRDTLVVAPLSVSRTFYSVMDRADSSRTSGPGVTTPQRYHPPDTVRVNNVYDPAGNLTTTWRTFKNNGQLLSLVGQWQYDAANRVYQVATAEGGAKTYTLDPAGNATTITSARGNTITTTYDALNRPTRRVLSQVSYANIACVLTPSYCAYSGLSFPTRDGPTVCLATDTSYFDYDPAGNVRRADNGWAWVHRTYTPSGLLAYDTLVVRTYETSAPYPCGPGDRHSGGVSEPYGDFSQHVYALQYGYDLDGRRDSLYHPDGIDFCSGSRCVTRYAYDAATGWLSSVTDPKGYVTSFGYDAAGRDTSMTYPGTVVARRGYDADSRVVARNGPFYTNDALQYDAADRVVSGTLADVGGQGQTSLDIRYGPLGAVVYASGLNPGTTFEEAIADGVGNRVWQRTDGWDSQFPDRQRNQYINSLTGREDSTRLVGATPFDPSNQYPNHYARLVHATSPDPDGNLQITYGWTYDGSAFPPTQAVSYFDAEDRLRIFNQHLGIGLPGSSGGVYEEYRYDALGRRVLVRSRCSNQRSNSWCRGYIERTVWDGDQVLYEIRAKGDDSASTVDEENDFFDGGSANNYDVVLGRVGYVHAGGMDQPIAVYRMGLYGQPSPVAVAPHANWQGAYEVGSVVGGSYNGYNTRTCQGANGCPVIAWPGGFTTMDGQLKPPTIHTWFGNLITQHTDGSGLHYLRNRYYDPATGRFTQADPIGLGGGLNLYGFAGGDPVAYSDPFGLKVCYRGVGRSALRSATEQATGSTLSLDDSGCIDDIGVADTSSKYNEARQRLQALVDAPETYTVALTGRGSNYEAGWIGIDRSDVGRPYEMMYDAGVCALGSAESLPSLIAHELLGHAFGSRHLTYRLQGRWGMEQYAMSAENAYHSAVREPIRCAY